jgi:CO/xanthine dehydrogenase Mo-binding subunit
VDALTRHLAVDPAIWRRSYALGPDGKDLRDGKEFGSIGLWDCIDEGKREFAWPLGVQTQDEQYWYGASLAVGIHGNGMYPVHTDLTTMGLKMNMDGSLVLNTGTVDMGTGANTSFRMIVAEVMGVALEKVGMQHGDTTACPFDLGCYASRSIYVAGNAALKVALSMRKRIEDETECKLENVDLGEYALQKFRQEARDISCQETYVSKADPMSYAAHFARVRVDKRTSSVEVLDYLAAHDIGRTINPMGLEGQIEGAIQMGIGMALQEGLRYDPSGKLINNSFKHYPLIKAEQMPEISVKLIESLESTGPFGAKSIGEIAAVPVAAAVTNAVSVAMDMVVDILPIDQITARRDR